MATIPRVILPEAPFLPEQLISAKARTAARMHLMVVFIEYSLNVKSVFSIELDCNPVNKILIKYCEK
jgi:hypothetical protein